MPLSPKVDHLVFGIANGYDRQEAVRKAPLTPEEFDELLGATQRQNDINILEGLIRRNLGMVDYLTGEPVSSGGKLDQDQQTKLLEAASQMRQAQPTDWNRGNISRLIDVMVRTPGAFSFTPNQIEYLWEQGHRGVHEIMAKTPRTEEFWQGFKPDYARHQALAEHPDQHPANIDRLLQYNLPVRVFLNHANLTPEQELKLVDRAGRVEDVHSMALRFNGRVGRGGAWPEALERKFIQHAFADPDDASWYGAKKPWYGVVFPPTTINKLLFDDPKNASRALDLIGGENFSDPQFVEQVANGLEAKAKGSEPGSAPYANYGKFLSRFADRLPIPKLHELLQSEVPTTVTIAAQQLLNRKGGLEDRDATYDAIARALPSSDWPTAAMIRQQLAAEPWAAKNPAFFLEDADPDVRRIFLQKHESSVPHEYVQKWARETGRGAERLRDSARKIIGMQDPDSIHNESVQIKFRANKLRQLRDLILASGKDEMHPNDLPKGDWSKGRLPNGNISAKKIQEYLDSPEDAIRYNISHDTWNGGQQHSDEPSKVLQVNLTTDQVKKLKEAGVYDTYQKMVEASKISGHPVGFGGLGWVRYTGNPKGLMIDEMQSDFGQSFVRQAAAQAEQEGLDPEEAAQKAEAEYPEEHYQKIKEILFGNKHPNEVLGEAFHQFLRSQEGLTCPDCGGSDLLSLNTGKVDCNRCGKTHEQDELVKGPLYVGTPIHIWQPKSKAYISLSDPEGKLPGHFQFTYRDLPSKIWGWGEHEYGDLPTQTNREHRGDSDPPSFHCPRCGSENLFQPEIHDEDGEPTGEYADYHECIDCGREFDEPEERGGGSGPAKKTYGGVLLKTEVPDHITRWMDVLQDPKVLTPDLRHSRYKTYSGVTVEALYHLIDGANTGWQPFLTQKEGKPHWYLQHTTGLILDPVDNYQTDYTRGVAKTLSDTPSLRAQELMERAKRLVPEPLHKGAMQRLAPFNPTTERLHPSEEATLARWQGPNREQNDRIAPDMPPNARLRALHKLSAATKVRRNEATGELEYLLHRGVSEEEYRYATDPPNVTDPDVVRGVLSGDGFVNHDQTSSWTPRYDFALNCARAYRRNRDVFAETGNHILSAWVPESAIGTIPKQMGALNSEADLFEEPEDNKGPLVGYNAYDTEHEVMVRDHHNSRIATPEEVRSINVPDAAPVGRRGPFWMRQSRQYLKPDALDQPGATSFGKAEDLNKSIGYLTFPHFGVDRAYSEPMPISENPKDPDRADRQLQQKVAGQVGAVPTNIPRPFNQKSPKLQEAKDVIARYMPKGSVQGAVTSTTRDRGPIASKYKMMPAYARGGNLASLKGVSNHETQHTVFARIGQIHGEQIRRHLAAKVVNHTILGRDRELRLTGLPPIMSRDLTGAIAKCSGYSFKDPEEIIAVHQNFLTDPTNREYVFRKLGISDPRTQAEIYKVMRQNWATMMAHARTIHPRDIQLIKPGYNPLSNSLAYPFEPYDHPSVITPELPPDTDLPEEFHKNTPPLALEPDIDPDDEVVELDRNLE